jgi:hypothetical protein
MAFTKYTSGVVNYVMDNYECECSSSEHHIKFRYFIEDDKPQMYVEIHLSDHQNFLKRIWHGILYIFGYKSKYGNFDEFIFKQEDVKNLKKLIEEFERNMK